MTPVLTRRALGRATLARQHLLERTDRDVAALVEHLVGLQAQTPHTWYVGLWGRIAGFRPEHASDLLEDRSLVRTALMRSTIHLVTARDALGLRPLVAPVIERSTKGSFGRHWVGLDRDLVGAAGREILEQEPVLFSELGRRLAARFPGRDPAALAQSVRSSEPLVQVTPRGLWGRSGAAAHTTTGAWLGDVAVHPITVDEMVLRYLGAFGPATVKDAQTWCGLTRLAEVLDRLRPGLMTVADEDGRELFDLPDAPRPDPETPAPPRLLYDYDNLLLSHADRSRFTSGDDYSEIWLNTTGFLGNVLVDGMLVGMWRFDQPTRVVQRGRTSGVLTITTT
ncbi:MAG: winged helix DNA-binding domain-containing protein, partial [Actinomycetes bacterium]